MRQQIRALEADHWFAYATMEQLLANSSAPRRFQTWLFGLFAALALVIAMVGIYGVISYAVSQRTQEIGIRMALGARASEVLWMVVWRGMSLTLIGVVLGLTAALALTRVMKNLLFEVSATDPATFALIALLLVGCRPDRDLHSGAPRDEGRSAPGSSSRIGVRDDLLFARTCRRRLPREIDFEVRRSKASRMC